MPLFRRMPKVGFNNARHTIAYIAVNLESLNQFEDGAKVDAQLLRDKGLANGPGAGIKILAVGELKKKLSVTAQAFSKTARTQIEKLGGTCEVVKASKRG